MEANNLTNKFTAAPIEKGTNILFELNATLEDYDVLYQMWSWDGVTAESFIFLSSDIVDLTDEEVKWKVMVSYQKTINNTFGAMNDYSGYRFLACSV